MLMKERKGAVTFKGAPLTLLGEPIQVGRPAPDVELLSNALQPVRLSSFRGKVLVLASVPSLDTPVCDTETRRFNQEATGLGKDVSVVVVSMDLPFAQKRWCGAAGVDRVQTLSDHREGAFGLAYGVLVKELRLLARAVWVVDRAGVVKYAQLVGEIASEPDYTPVLTAAKSCV
jgi:thiol peroxidase